MTSGRVAVGTADCLRQTRCLTISTEVSPAAVAVSVRDAGTGLPAELDGTLFMPFVTTKAQGMGLGLAVCRTIVSAHGGKLWADSNPGGGATFHVMLPTLASGVS